MNRHRRIWTVVKCLSAALVVVCLVLLGREICREAEPSKPDYTYAVLQSIKRRVIRYGRRHGEVPTDLRQLPPVRDEVSDLEDAWGFPIDYTRNKDGSITLVSHGADGRPGGEAAARDMIGTFHPKTESGAWREEMCDWTENPRSSRR
jgi:hypothetical protein